VLCEQEKIFYWFLLFDNIMYSAIALAVQERDSIIKLFDAFIAA